MQKALSILSPIIYSFHHNNLYNKKSHKISMLLRQLRLQNIRSYLDETINFPEVLRCFPATLVRGNRPSFWYHRICFIWRFPVGSACRIAAAERSGERIRRIGFSPARAGNNCPTKPQERKRCRPADAGAYHHQ